MRAQLFVFAFALWAQAAAAADEIAGPEDFPLPPGAAQPAMASPASRYDVDTPIETLAANEVTAAVLEKYIPGLLEDPSYPMFKGMSLKTVASLSGGQISSETMEAISAELKSIPAATPPGRAE